VNDAAPYDRFSRFTVRELANLVIRPEWLTDAVVGIAQHGVDLGLTGDDANKLFADALEDAGCQDTELLQHIRTPHGFKCTFLDAVCLLRPLSQS
jgi:hypothetical protein